jgi:hypothetical protein
MSFPQNLREPLQGRTSLRKVFWLYGLAASIVYGVLGLAVPAGSVVAAGVYLVGGIILGIYQLIALWQCAFNGRSRSVGVLVRISVVASVLLIPVIVYVMMTLPLMVAP